MSDFFTDISMWKIRCEDIFEGFVLSLFGRRHFGHTELCSNRSTVHYTVAAEVVSTINSTTLYLVKVLSDLPSLMGPKQFAYQMKHKPIFRT